MTDLKNIGIEAGAGCGKTHRLVHDLSDALKYGNLELNKAVVITFTRKAADELSTRIAFVLQQEISVGNKAMEAQLKQLASAPIGTIHSFCSRILKEKAIEAGVDPAFMILEEDAPDLAGEIFKNWFAARLDKFDKFFSDWAVFLEREFRSPDDDFGIDNSLQGALLTVLNHRDIPLYELPVPEEFDAIFARYKGELNSILSLVEAKTLSDFMQEYINTITRYSSLEKNQRLQSFYDLKYKPANLGGAAESENKENWKAVCEDMIGEIAYQTDYPLIKLLHQGFKEASADFIVYYREELRLKGYMDFTDILVRTEELLRTNDRVRNYFKNKFDRIFVDEFQDTDPLQIKILYYLTSNGDALPSDVNDVSLACGKVYAVGDPKQSIYRFRRADIEMFQSAMGKISAGPDGKKDILDKNFRSKKEILEWVNDFFTDRIRQPEDGNYQAEYAGIFPSEKTEAGGVVQFVQPAEAAVDKEKIEITRDREARLTALKIKNLIDAGRSPAEILVLYRNKKNMLNTAEYLEELEVPCEIEGGSIFFGRSEVGDLITLLGAILHPLDTIITASALRGPFFALSDKDLFFHYRESSVAEKKSPFDYRFEHVDSEAGRALLRLKEYHELSLNMTAYEVVEKIIEDTGILASYYAGFRGKRKVLNILKAVEILRSYGRISFADAYYRIKKAYDENREMDDLQLHGSGGRMVRMMSIHKSKGMESDVVYLADTTSLNTRKSQSVFTDSSKGLILNLYKKVVPPEFRKLKEKNLRREEAEAERLRYVAATRAKSVLLINKIEIKKSKEAEEKNLTVYFQEPFFAAADPQVEIIATDGLGKTFGMKNKLAKVKPGRIFGKEEKELAELPQKWQKLAESKFQVLSPSSAYGMGEGDLFVESAGLDAYVLADHVSKSTAGTMLHRLLEVRPKNPENTVRTIALREGLDLPADEIAGVYRQYLTKEILQRAEKGLQSYRELPLKFKASDSNYYDGIIDLLFEEKDGWVLVDYKLSAAVSDEDKEKLKAKYNAQMELYAEGLALAGIKVKEKVLLGM